MMRSTCEVSQQDDLARQEATMADVGNPLALLPVDLIGFRKRCHKLIRECGFAYRFLYNGTLIATRRISISTFSTV